MEKEGESTFLLLPAIWLVYQKHELKILVKLPAVCYISLLQCYSLGCGIGYGYLHRIPSEVLEEKAKARGVAPIPSPTQPVTSSQASVPPQPGAPLAPNTTDSKQPMDGFSDVSICNSDVHAI